MGGWTYRDTWIKNMHHYLYLFPWGCIFFFIFVWKTINGKKYLTSYPAADREDSAIVCFHPPSTSSISYGRHVSAGWGTFSPDSRLGSVGEASVTANPGNRNRNRNCTRRKIVGFSRWRIVSVVSLHVVNLEAKGFNYLCKRLVVKPFSFGSQPTTWSKRFGNASRVRGAH